MAAFQCSHESFSPFLVIKATHSSSWGQGEIGSLNVLVNFKGKVFLKKNRNSDLPFTNVSFHFLSLILGKANILSGRGRPKGPKEPSRRAEQGEGAS